MADTLAHHGNGVFTDFGVGQSDFAVTDQRLGKRQFLLLRQGGVDQCDEIAGNVPMGVIGDPMSEHVTPIQALVVKGMETNPLSSAG